MSNSLGHRLHYEQQVQRISAGKLSTMSVQPAKLRLDAYALRMQQTPNINQPRHCQFLHGNSDQLERQHISWKASSTLHHHTVGPIRKLAHPSPCTSRRAGGHACRCSEAVCTAISSWRTCLVTDYERKLGLIPWSVDLMFILLNSDELVRRDNRDEKKNYNEECENEKIDSINEKQGECDQEARENQMEVDRSSPHLVRNAGKEKKEFQRKEHHGEH